MGAPGMAKYNLQTVTAAAAARVGSNDDHKLMGFLLFGGTADSQVEFKNAATDTGDVLMGGNALLDTSFFADFTRFGGVKFSTAMFCKPAGAGAICYVWFD